MIEIFDSRRDADHNVVVRPELRGRFLRLDPAPAPRQHSHDLAGEAFLVLEGRCRFLIGEEEAECGPGQLVYVDKGVRHSMRAIDEPCTMWLSVTPHVEPTHTFYDDSGERTPVRYDAWRGERLPDGSAMPGRPAADPSFDDGTLAARLVETLGELHAASELATAEAVRYRATSGDASPSEDRERMRVATDRLWAAIRPLLERVSAAESAWNAVAEHAMDGLPVQAGTTR